MLKIPNPYQCQQPKAVHYFSVLQEIGSNHISQLKSGSILAWRKDVLPKSGDTGHVLLIAGEPENIEDDRYRVCVIDSTKYQEGLAKRYIELHTSKEGKIIGVRLHLHESKVKRTAIYHHPIEAARYCFGCGLPKRVCGCAAISPILTAPPVVILRHSSERKKTLSTVSLIKQRYPAVLVKDGESFDPIRSNNLALLFPGDDADLAGIDTQSNLTIILIDATWRKARKILQINPWLRSLPKIAIKPEKISNYLLRKVPNAEALSSVEAFAVVMRDAELAESLSDFMSRNIEVMGEHKYRENYQKHLNFKKDKSP